MENIHLKRLTGHASHVKIGYKQITTADGAITDQFYAFMPVNGDVTVTALTDVNGSDATGSNAGGTYYQNVLYTGSFGGITILTGEAILYLS